MNKASWISLAAITFAILSLAGSMVYSQGKDSERLDNLSATDAEIKEDLKDIKDDFDAEQRQQYEDLNESINGLRDLIIDNL